MKVWLTVSVRYGLIDSLLAGGVTAGLYTVDRRAELRFRQTAKTSHIASETLPYHNPMHVLSSSHHQQLSKPQQSIISAHAL